MRAITVFVLTAALASVAAPAAAQTTTAVAHESTVTVQGSGTVERAPDQTVVTFTIETNDDRAAVATSKNNAIYAALSARLAGFGITGKAVRTTNFNVSYNPRPLRAPVEATGLYGYVANRSVVVTDERVDRAGALIDAAVSAGATGVGGVGFGIRDPRGAFRDAQAAAVADARAQAQTLASASGMRLGRLLSLNGGNAFLPGPRPANVMFSRMASAASVPTEVQPSDLSVTASVGMTYALLPS